MLGVPPGAGVESIARAYRRRALELHPDHNPDDDAAERFRRLVAARAVLLAGTSDAADAVQRTAAAAASGPPDRRNAGASTASWSGAPFVPATEAVARQGYVIAFQSSVTSTIVGTHQVHLYGTPRLGGTVTVDGPASVFAVNDAFTIRYFDGLKVWQLVAVAKAVHGLVGQRVRLSALVALAPVVVDARGQLRRPLTATVQARAIRGAVNASNDAELVVVDVSSNGIGLVGSGLEIAVGDALEVTAGGVSVPYLVVRHHGNGAQWRIGAVARTSEGEALCRALLEARASPFGQSEHAHHSGEATTARRRTTVDTPPPRVSTGFHSRRGRSPGR